MRGVVPAVLLLMLLAVPAYARDRLPIALDPSKVYSLYDIAATQRDHEPWVEPGAFVPSHQASMFSRRVISFSVRVKGDPNVGWVIRVPMQIDEIELIDPNGPVIVGGMRMPVADRPAYDRITILPVPAHLLDGTPFVVRMRTSTEVRAPRLMTAAASQVEEQGTRAVTFFFIGFFVAVGLIFMLIFSTLHERGLLLYAFVMLSLAVFEAINKCYAWQYLWPHASLEWHVPNALAFWLYYLALVSFCAAFLRTAGRSNWFRYAAFALLALALPAELASAYAHDMPGVVAFAQLDAFLMLSALLAWAVSAYRLGQRAAKYYVVAFAGVFIGNIVNHLALDQFIPHVAFTEWIFEVGIAWEAVWLGLAIASSLQETAQENALLHASELQLQRLATIDGLTAVANRRTFDERLQSEWNRAARTGNGLGLLFADVDHFKQYNDTFGHLAGDDCLRRVAFAIAKFAGRASDLCARYGGEEFAVLIPETDLASATTLAETIRAEVQALTIPHPATVARYVTISIGVAVASAATDGNPMMLIAEADRALYQAKSRGRNLVMSIRDLVAE